MRYKFDWDPTKEAKNIRKHKLDFRRAAAVFHDPNQVSIYDEGHSKTEDRWVTIGIDSNGVLRVIVHTYEQFADSLCEICIISARKATKKEARHYREGPV